MIWYVCAAIVMVAQAYWLLGWWQAIFVGIMDAGVAWCAVRLQSWMLGRNDLIMDLIDVPHWGGGRDTSFAVRSAPAGDQRPN